MTEQTEPRTPTPTIRPRSRARRVVALLTTVLVMTPLLCLGGLAIATRTEHLSMALVTSGSMTGYADPGDLVVTRRVDSVDVEVGDVLTVPKTHTSNRDVLYVTHRVVDVDRQSGITTIRTQGDAVDNPDVSPVMLGPTTQRAVLVVPDIGQAVWWATRSPGVWWLIVGYVVLAVAYLCWPRRWERRVMTAARREREVEPEHVDA